MVLAKSMESLMEGNSVIRKMFELGREMAKKYGKDAVYDFSLGNPVAEVPYEVKNAIISLLENQDPHEIHGYMQNARGGGGASEKTLFCRLYEGKYSSLRRCGGWLKYPRALPFG